MAGRRRVSFVNRYRCADGATLLESRAPFRYRDRQLLFAIARDITDRKRGEEAERADRDAAATWDRAGDTAQPRCTAGPR